MKNKRILSGLLTAMFGLTAFCNSFSTALAADNVSYYKPGTEQADYLATDSTLSVAEEGEKLYVTGIREDTLSMDLSQEFSCSIAFVDNEGQSITAPFTLKTGDIISATKLCLTKKFIAVVNGDVDGNGAINSTDYVLIKRHSLKVKLLEGAYFLAADIDMNGKIDSSDLILLKRHLLKIHLIGSDDTKAQVPDLTGLTEAVAKSKLNSLGLEAFVVPCIGTAADKGTVLYQSITPGATVSKGTKVSVSVSNGMTAEESALVKMEDPHVTNREVLAEGANKDYVPVNYENMKAIWLSQLDLGEDYVGAATTFWQGNAVYYDGVNKHQTYQDAFTKYIKKIMQNIKDSGFNTVIVQVHPDSDSMYPSALYPWSDYMLGGYGSVSGYDLLQIMLDEAHALDLSFHAWINPMRCMTEDEIKNVNINYPIRQWYEDAEKKNTYLFQSGKRIYLNPAYEEVRKYIADVATELVRYYDVDAVHMDDYFYPDANTAYDKAAFAAQSEFKTLNAFRCNNVDLMVKEIYNAVKRENPNVLYGISPRGSVEQSKDLLGADVQKWVSNDGFIDYIIPQIYFGFLHKTSAFDTLTTKWANITTADSVKLYIGIGIYKQNTVDTYAGDVNAKYEWKNNDDIAKRELEYLKDKENVDGFCIFSYQYIYNMLSGEYNESNKPESDNFLPVIPTIFN